MNVKDLIDLESATSEVAKDTQILASTKVTRGHGRTQTLQVRLTDEEYQLVSAFAADSGLPVSTVARDVLLAGIAKESPHANSAVAVISRIRSDLDMLATKVS